MRLLTDLNDYRGIVKRIHRFTGWLELMPAHPHLDRYAGQLFDLEKRIQMRLAFSFFPRSHCGMCDVYLTREHGAAPSLGRLF